MVAVAAAIAALVQAVHTPASWTWQVEGRTSNGISASIALCEPQHFQGLTTGAAFTCTGSGSRREPQAVHPHNVFRHLQLCCASQ